MRAFPERAFPERIRLGAGAYQRRSIDCCSALRAPARGSAGPGWGLGGGLGLSFMSVVLPGMTRVEVRRTGAFRRGTRGLREVSRRCLVAAPLVTSRVAPAPSGRK